MEISDTEKQSASGSAAEIQALNAILAAFSKLDAESRERVFQTVATFFGLQTAATMFGFGPRLATRSAAPPSDSTPNGQRAKEPSFSEDRSLSPKQFMFEKQPKTDVEKVACLAYYLTHYLQTPHFKTLDISRLNTEAAQVKFANPAVAVENATRLSYLVPATKGMKQISALGEQFVLALPDRERGKLIMKTARPRRRNRKNDQQPDDEGQE